MGKGDLVQKAEAHGQHGAKLFALVDSNVPNDLPRNDGKDDIHDARIDYPTVSESFTLLVVETYCW